MPRLLTIDEVATQLASCRATVYSLIRSGQLESVKIGRSRRVSDAAIAEFIARNTQVGAS